MLRQSLALFFPVLFSSAAIAAPFKGGTLVPAPDLLIPGLPLDAQGALTLTFAWPPGIPSGLDLWWCASVVILVCCACGHPWEPTVADGGTTS